jgi:hypothetical protein
MEFEFARARPWSSRPYNGLMKPLPLTIVVVAALGLLVYTNPKMADFELYVHARIVEKSEKKDDVSKAVGKLLGGFASSLIVNTATRSDYVFFSIFNATLEGDEVKVLGMLNNFIVVQRLKSD